MILGLAVRDMEQTRALKLNLEILQGVRPDDPARELLMDHSRTLSDELASVRELRESLREATRRENAELDTMMRRALPDGDT
jgi:hypothetical protein